MSNSFVMTRIKHNPTLKYFAIMILMFSILLGLRWAWSNLFYTLDHPRASDGVFDLRGFDLDESPSFFLDGEWQFYPNQFISTQDIQSKENQFRSIQVPGDWESVLNKDSGTSYGYGTYRLRILIDPPKQPVAIWIQGIQAASEVEINGMTSSGVGKLTANANEYIRAQSACRYLHRILVGSQRLRDQACRRAGTTVPHQGINHAEAIHQ